MTKYNAAYKRGYYAGSKRAWPAHRPPLPPDELVAALMTAATALRDSVDGYLATIDPDDELADTLGPAVDAVDAVMVRITAWLRESGS